MLPKSPDTHRTAAADPPALGSTNEDSGTMAGKKNKRRRERRWRTQRAARLRRATSPQDESPVAEQPSIDWALATRHVSTMDILEGIDLEDSSAIQLAVEQFTWWLESDRYATWDAVIRDEQGLPLSRRQRELLDGLRCFEEDSRRTRTIDEMPRPSEPWYETLRRLARRMLLPQIQTQKVYYEGEIEAWEELRETLEAVAEDLSLPPGATRPVDVLEDDLRHRLEVQVCFDRLVGVGQPGAGGSPITLKDGDEEWRLLRFVQALRDRVESVAFLDLSLEGLMEIVVLPPRDREPLARFMKDQLGLETGRERLAAHLTPRSHAAARALKVGDAVRVKDGVECPDFAGLSLGGWRGRITQPSECDDEVVEIQWDSATLAQIPEEYIRQSKDEDLAWDRMALNPTDLDPVSPRDTHADVKRTVLEREERYDSE